jgi:hypothetical protein
MTSWWMKADSLWNEKKKAKAVRALHEFGPCLDHPNDEGLSSGTPVRETWGTCLDLLVPP